MLILCKQFGPRSGLTNQNFFQEHYQRVSVWVQIRTNILSVLILVQTVCKCYQQTTSVVPCQGSQSPDFGAEIRPHSQCQKVCFFPNSRQKIPNLTKKKKIFFFFFFGSPSLFHIIQILTVNLNCLITNNYVIYQEKR